MQQFPLMIIFSNLIQDFKLSKDNFVYRALLTELDIPIFSLT
jgi:hypothetical protein